MEQHKILVVDDELLIRDLLYDFFAEKDCLIMTANDVNEALELLDKNADFDVVLTDLKMDGEDGLSFVDKIRTDFPQMPVIVMTGYPSVESAVEALRKRVYDYIIKPFNINRLYATVRAASEEHRQSQRQTTQVQKEYV